MLSIAQKWDKIIETSKNLTKPKIVNIGKMCKGIYGMN
jgi:hypothetical protein